MKKTPPSVWIVTIILAVIATIWFLWPQIAVLVFAALMAYIFYPLYRKLHRKKGHAAAATTLLASFLIVLLPLAIVAIAAANQLITFANLANQSGTWQHIPSIVTQAITTVNDIISPLTGTNPSITEQGVIGYLHDVMPGIARASINVLLGFVATVPQLSLAFVIYSFAFVEFLRRGPDLVRNLKAISPFTPAVTEQYLEHVALMANAMVKGQLMISMIISFISALLLVPLGYGGYFFILFILFTILNFIPLGCGLVLIPLTLYSMLTGQFWAGVVVLVLYNFTGYLDPVLRPRFIPKKIQLSSALTIISTFCGIAYFGILGVVYGPIAMILLITTYELYITAKTSPRTAGDQKIVSR